MENPLVAAGIALVFFGIGSFFGQIGIIAAGLVLVAIGSSSQSGDDSTDPAGKANCPSCAARNDPDSATCHRCGTVLSEE